MNHVEQIIWPIDPAPDTVYYGITFLLTEKPPYSVIYMGQWDYTRGFQLNIGRRREPMGPIIQNSGMKSPAGNPPPRKDPNVDMKYILFSSSGHLMAFGDNHRKVAEESAVIPREHQDLRFDVRTLFLHVRRKGDKIIVSVLARLQEVLLHLLELL